MSEIKGLTSGTRLQFLVLVFRRFVLQMGRMVFVVPTSSMEFLPHASHAAPLLEQHGIRHCFVKQAFSWVKKQD